MKRQPISSEKRLLSVLTKHSVGFALTIIAGLPASALACPMCFSAKNEAGRVAYLATTGVLSFLPLIVIGSTILLVKRHIDKNSPTPRSSRTEV